MRLPLVGFGPLHGECMGQDPKGRPNGPARTLRPLRKPDGGDELVMDVPAIKDIMSEHFQVAGALRQTRARWQPLTGMELVALGVWRHAPLSLA